MNKITQLIIVDVLLQIVILFITFYLLFIFSQESNAHGDSRLYLIFVYSWYAFANFIFVIIQLYNSPITRSDFQLLLKKKRKILQIQIIVTILPILLFCYKFYLYNALLIWFFYFGLFFFSITFLYAFILNKVSNKNN